MSIVGLTIERPFVAGLQLGGLQTPAALAIIERRPGETEEAPVTHELRLLERWAAGLPYTMIVRQVTRRFRMALAQASKNRDAMGQPVKTALSERTAALVVNATGVGKMAVDILERELPGLRSVPTWITTSDQASEDTEGWRVPQRDLIAAVLVLDQQERLAVPKSLADAAALKAQMDAYHVKPGTSDRARFEPAGGDDLVLAVALACWWGELVAPARVDILAGPFGAWSAEALEYERQKRRVKSMPAKITGPMSEGV